METTIDFLLNLHAEFEVYENELESERKELERIQRESMMMSNGALSLYRNSYDMSDVSNGVAKENLQRNNSRVNQNNINSQKTSKMIINHRQ